MIRQDTRTGFPADDRGPRDAWVFFLIVQALAGFGIASASDNSPGPVEVASRPMFERNVGQAAASVRFLVRTPGEAVWITDHETVWKFPASDGDVESWPAVHMRLLGARAEAPVVGRDELPTFVNDFRGKNAAEWHTRIPTYARVVRESVYPGIDLQLRFEERSLEYDFLLRPGADPDRIRYRMDGGSTLTLDDQDNLVIDLGDRRLVHAAPQAWQEAPAGRMPVEVEFTVTGGVVGFELGEYDPTHPLFIDPLVRYSSYLGGNGQDESAVLGRGPRVAVHADGTAIVAMTTQSFGLPSTLFPPVDPPCCGDGYIAKIAADGDTLLWATYLGGSHIDDINDLALDFAGRVYVAGQTYSTDFPEFPAGSGQCSTETKPDAFVTRLESDGSALVYSTCVGGSEWDRGWALTVDLAGEAIVVGSTFSDDFPKTAGRFQEALNQGGGSPEDGVVFRLDAQGQHLWSTYLGGTDTEWIYDVGLDHSGSILVAGRTDSDDFPTTPGALHENPSGGAFVSVLSGSGRMLPISTYLAGANPIYVAEGPEDRIYVAGNGVPPDAMPPGAYQPTPPEGESTGFVVALDFDLTAIEHGTFLHTTNGPTHVRGMHPTAGAVTVLTSSVACPGDVGVDPDTGPWIVSLSPELSARYGCVEFGSAVPSDIEVSDLGDVYLTGTTGPDEIPIVHAFQNEFGGGPSDAFAARITPWPLAEWLGSSFAWRDLLGVRTYDVVCGDLPVLRLTDGDFSQAGLHCFADDLGTQDVDLSRLEPDRFCLVRSVTRYGDGTWDVGGAQVGSRDNLIDGAPGACELNPLCSHSLCTVSGPLEETCDPCVSAVCAVDANCCAEEWHQGCVDLVAPICGVVGCFQSDLECAHSLCLSGDALTPGCDEPPLANSCVDAICSVAPDCCDPESEWSPGCVDMVETICGLTCEG